MTEKAGMRKVHVGAAADGGTRVLWDTISGPARPTTLTYTGSYGHRQPELAGPTIKLPRPPVVRHEEAARQDGATIVHVAASNWHEAPLRSGITALAAVMTLPAVGTGVTGCASRGPQVTTAALPTVVCSTVLSDSAAGPVVFDATRRLPVVRYLIVGDVLMVRVVPGCDEGAHVSRVPSTAAQLVKAAYARDGLRPRWCCSRAGRARRSG
jgi:hypothetical protein